MRSVQARTGSFVSLAKVYLLQLVQRASTRFFVLDAHARNMPRSIAGAVWWHLEHSITHCSALSMAACLRLEMDGDALTGAF